MTAVKTFFFHYWLGHVLGLSIVCNESSGNGGSRFPCKQTGEKVIAQIYQNRPMCTDSFTITNRSYSLSEDLKKFLSVNQQNFSFVTLPSNEGCSQFSLCLLVTVNLEWSDRNQEAKTTKHNPQCMRLSYSWSTLENHIKMYCDHLDTCSSCIQYSAHFFLQWPIPIPALDSHGPNQKLPFPDVKKGPSSILKHDSPHKLREVNLYQLLQLENCHCSSFFPLFFWRLSWVETHTQTHTQTHTHTEREREKERWTEMFHWCDSKSWSTATHLSGGQ